jgi:hypothetical protein
MGDVEAADWLCFGSSSTMRITLALYSIVASSEELSSARLDESASPSGVNGEPQQAFRSTEE